MILYGYDRLDRECGKLYSIKDIIFLVNKMIFKNKGGRIVIDKRNLRF